MEKLSEELLRLQIGKVSLNEPLANHTTMKVGGPAALFVEPSSIENIVTLLNILKEKEVAHYVIGRGSNILFPDEGVDGVVVKIGPKLGGVDLDRTTVRVGAGQSFIGLSVLMARENLTGLEFAAGIPGSVGGAVYMNAGAHGSNVAAILTKAHVLFPDGTLKWLTNEEMSFSYRTSMLQTERKALLLEAVFQLQKGDKDKINEEMRKNKAYRQETQPWNAPCSGSIFRNPLPKHAGKLIEDAGLKGLSVGGAKVSELHANFIVNEGNATANDVRQLIAILKEKIFTTYGVELQTELEIIVQK